MTKADYLRIHIDYGVSEKCNNPHSHGEICVKCGECGREFNEKGLCVNINEYPVCNYEEEE